MYAPKNRDTKFMKQNLTELKRQIDNSINLDEEFETPLSMMKTTDRRSTKKGETQAMCSCSQMFLQIL